MTAHRFTSSFIFFLFLTSVNAQNKNFELNNPNSIFIDSEILETLTSGYWRLFQNDVENRGSTTSTRKNNSLCYYPDGTLFFNGSTGTWKILEDRYIEHKLDKEVQQRLNFGGIFSITQLDNSTLTLAKLLTSSHDMKRTLFLKSSSILTVTEQPNFAGPYLFDGPLSESAIDSISRMDPDELFNAGFSIIGSGLVHIITPDTTYSVRVKSN